MTMYEAQSESDMNTTSPFTMSHFTDRNLDTKNGTLNIDTTVSLSENGPFISADTGGHTVNHLMVLDSTSLALRPCSYKNAEGNDMDTLCDQVGSVKMTDLQDLQKRECFNGIVVSERNLANGLLAENFDSATIYTRDNDGDTFLHTAIILREITLVMLFISKSPSTSWLSFKNLMFQTALHLSVLTNQPDITRRLIVAGVEIDARDKDGNTALHIACRDGLLNNVQYLLEPVRYHEMKQNSYDIPYQTIPQDFSIRNYQGLTCLHLAALNGHLDIIEALLDKGIDVNLKEGKTGRSILHDACIHGNKDLVKLLLRHRDCNINARAFDDITPFELALVRGHDHACMLLAAAGARYGEEFSDSD